MNVQTKTNCPYRKHNARESQNKTKLIHSLLNVQTKKMCIHISIHICMDMCYDICVSFSYFLKAKNWEIWETRILSPRNPDQYEQAPEAETDITIIYSLCQKAYSMTELSWEKISQGIPQVFCCGSFVPWYAQAKFQMKNSSLDCLGRLCNICLWYLSNKSLHINENSCFCFICGTFIYMKRKTFENHH